ncbi:MAG: hypothetical protein PHC88_15415 [Terrimicrobiaceae bacterium]|nr:hypothetical protein [Terrimicrobiaceae bacterium]
MPVLETLPFGYNVSNFFELSHGAGNLLVALPEPLAALLRSVSLAVLLIVARSRGRTFGV